MQNTSSLSIQSPSAVISSANVEKPRSMHLLGPRIDSLTIGGLSLLFFSLSYLLIDKSANINQISWTMFYLAFLVNNPHFIASYQLLYWDNRRFLLTQPRFFWAAFVVPTLLLAYLVSSIIAESRTALGYIPVFMYITVGWHYIKQIYGTAIVCSARTGYFLSKNESLVLRYALMPLWALSFISANSSARTLEHYGIPYASFELDPLFLTSAYWSVALSAVVILGLFARKWLMTGKIPALASVVAIVSIYVWYIPSLYHPIFWYAIPFFHSLQYLLFVTALKLNESKAAAAAVSDPIEQRKILATKFFGFIAISVVVAYFMFKGVPEFLDAYVPYDTELMGKQFFMFSFITLINIHHYFIDNVIWRKDNAAVRQYL